ncbi:MAG: hypothetical protein KAG89_12275 [Fulvimarina manganoxydans]|uniref:hypothetical protein n=1 Tax=Fulvimarina manganoxydans TaxID=937218 RepID=UPI002354EAD9|nr:hypothetical protein [Fulvimarina manganoxydans]MCK5932935.1 hypothetical protein [Fulvimarina manganoxydans]
MTIETVKAAILPKLLESAAAFDPATGTPVEAELAAAQLLVYEDLLKSTREKDALANAGDPELRTIEGKAYPGNRVTRGLTNVQYIHTAGYRHPPVLTDDGLLVWGGRHQTSQGGTSQFTFVRGEVDGKKTVVSGLIPNASTDLQYSSVIYDAKNELAYHPVESAGTGTITVSVHNFRTLNSSTVSRNEMNGTPKAATWHPWLQKSIWATSTGKVWYADNINQAHVEATLPDMTGVAFSNAACNIANSPTAALIFTSRISDNAKAILRSTDGETFAFIAGIAGVPDNAAVYGAYWHANRLWVLIGGGLYSTADDGDTWREDIPQSAGVQRLGYDPEIGSFVAWANTGSVFNSVNGDEWVKSSYQTAAIGINSFFSPADRLIYGYATIASDHGEKLLSGSDFTVTPYKNGSGHSHDGIGPVIPHGDDQIWALRFSTGQPTSAAIVEMNYRVYQPPAEGAQISILAIGSGGTINVGTAIDGLPTIVSNLLVAAGGADSETTPAEAGVLNRGTYPVLLAGTGSGGTYEWRGGEGISHRGEVYGSGETVIGNSTTHPPDSVTGFTGLNGTDRGGWPGVTATWQGRVTGPVPMLPSAGVYDSAGYNKSGDGAVIIREF